MKVTRTEKTYRFSEVFGWYELVIALMFGVIAGKVAYFIFDAPNSTAALIACLSFIFLSILYSMEDIKIKVIEKKYNEEQ